MIELLEILGGPLFQSLGCVVEFVCYFWCYIWKALSLLLQSLLHAAIWLVAIPIIIVISPFGRFSYNRNFRNHTRALATRI